MVIFNGVHIEAMTSKGTSHSASYGAWPERIFDLPLIGEGSCKAAYALPGGKHVLKIESPYAEFSQLRNEIAVWCHAPAELEHDLAAIYDFGANWIIAERAIPIDLETEDDDSRLEIYEFSYQFCGYGRWTIPDVCMHESGNFGRRVSDGSLCVIDYSGGFGTPDYHLW